MVLKHSLWWLKTEPHRTPKGFCNQIGVGLSLGRTVHNPWLLRICNMRKLNSKKWTCGQYWGPTALLPSSSWLCFCGTQRVKFFSQHTYSFYMMTSGTHHLVSSAGKPWGVVGVFLLCCSRWPRMFDPPTIASQLTWLQLCGITHCLRNPQCEQNTKCALFPAIYPWVQEYYVLYFSSMAKKADKPNMPFSVTILNLSYFPKQHSFFPIR